MGDPTPEEQAYAERYRRAEGLKQEVRDLGEELRAAPVAGWPPERITKAGQRQAELVHEILDLYDLDEDLADELGLTEQGILGLNSMYLAEQPDGGIGSPELN